MALVLKTRGSKGSVSSNLTASASLWAGSLMVKQPTHNRLSLGSIPSQPTKEIWMSGLNQWFAKPSFIEIWTAGSNPAISAKFCSRSLMVKLRAYTSAMPLDEGMIQVRILSGVPHPCGQIGKVDSLKRSSSLGSNPSRGTIPY